MGGFSPLLFPAVGVKLSTTGGKLQGESLSANLFLEVLNPLLHEVLDTEGGKTTLECLSGLIDRAGEGETEDGNRNEVSLPCEMGFLALTVVPWQGVSSPLLVFPDSMVEGETECQADQITDLLVDGESTFEGESLKAVTTATEMTELFPGNDTSKGLGKTLEGVIPQGIDQRKSDSVFSLNSEGETECQSDQITDLLVDGESTFEGESLKTVTTATEMTELFPGNDTSKSLGRATEGVIPQGINQVRKSSVFYPDTMLEGKALYQSDLVQKTPILNREVALEGTAQPRPSAENRTNSFTQLSAGVTQENFLPNTKAILVQDTTDRESEISNIQENFDPAQVLLRGTADFQQAGDKNSIITQGIEQVQETEAELPAQKVIDQIVENAHLFLGKDKSALRLQLKPEVLGHLDIVVKVEKGLAHAHFIAENAAVAKIIQGYLPELRQSLEQQGVSWQQLSVSVDSQSGSTEFYSSGSGAESSSEHGSPGYQGSFEGWSGEHQEGGERPQLTGLIDYLI
jgi:hypothetical protein